MMIYPSFVYLQNHKTGCTFVEAFLRRFCAEPLLAYDKHAVLAAAPGKFCFANVREPMDLYRSLFTYGLDGRGLVFQRLRRLGHGSLYEQGPDGFADWLSFVLRPEHAPLLSERYRPHTARHMGLMTWRLLRLACPGFEEHALRISDPASLPQWIAQHWGLDFVVRQERLKEDLAALTRGALAGVIADPARALDWLSQAQPINASEADASHVSLPPVLVRQVQKREAFIYERFYPECLATPAGPELASEQGACP